MACAFFVYTLCLSLITHSLYLKLRFPSVVPSLSPSGSEPTTNQRRTKEQHRNSQTTKVLFVKIAVSFTSLVPCLIPPREHREKTERTPTQLPAYKKCFFLRWLPKEVSTFPKKVDYNPKKIYCRKMLLRHKIYNIHK